MRNPTFRRQRWLAIAGIATLLALAGGRPGIAAGFRCNACDLKAADVERCRRIDPAEYSTALLFNPPGMTTLFKRSSCLQRIAVEYRDASLCAEVRERKSLFFDGSAISRASCEERVRERVRDDPKVVIADIHRLADVAYFRDGNGRDIDVRVGVSGSHRHRYELMVAMVDEAGSVIETLHRRDYQLGPDAGPLHVLVRQAQVAAVAGALGLESPYRFQVTLALVEPTLAELRQFVALPAELRKSTVEHRVDPARLERDTAGPGP